MMRILTVAVICLRGKALCSLGSLCAETVTRGMWDGDYEGETQLLIN